MSAKILQERYDLIQKKVSEFQLINKVLQTKIIHLLECISNKEDNSGLITREYDQLSNDISAVQSIIEKFGTEMEDIKSKLDVIKNHQLDKNPIICEPQSCIGNNQSNQIPLNNYSTINNVPPVPTKCLLRANLPDNQMTSVEVKANTTLLCALEKKLLNRGLDSNKLKAYLKGKSIPWNTDAVRVAMTGETISVRYTEKRLFKTYHQIQRKTFFEKQYCDICHKFVFIGVSCKICWGAYHVRCVGKSKCVVGDDEVFATNFSGESSSGYNSKLTNPTVKSHRKKRRKFFPICFSISNSLCCVKKRSKSSKRINTVSQQSENSFEIIPLEKDTRLRTYSEETTMTVISVLPNTVEENISNILEDKIVKKYNFKRSHSAAVNFPRDFEIKTALTESQASFEGDMSIYNYSEGSLKSILTEMDNITLSNYGSSYLKQIKEIPLDSEEESTPCLLPNQKSARRTISCREPPKIFIEDDELLKNVVQINPSHSTKSNFYSSNIDRQLSAPNMRMRISHYPEYQNYHFSNYLGICVRLNNGITNCFM